MEDERATTPSNEHVLKLPRWARVAFAARCARRVQPVFAEWKDATQQHLDDVDRAITLSEASARMARAEASPKAYEDAASASRAAREAAGAAYEDAAAYAAYAAAGARAHAAYPAASAAALAARAAADDATASDAAFDASEAAFASTYSAAAVTAAIWSDYDRLLALATAEAWTDDTPVDISRLGPL